MMIDQKDPTSKSFLDNELRELERYIEFGDQRNPETSKANVAWHLDHTLKSINRIYRALLSSDPNNYRWKANIGRMYVFTTGSIPRGKGKSPASVMPPDHIETEDLRKQVTEARQIAKKMDTLHPGSNFEHPNFGQLNKKDAKRFIEIHTNHHLKIIRDIIGNP